MTALALRTTFTTSRLLEFCSAKELVAQTGHEPDDWPLVVLKELVDNALDACEEAGATPVIRVTVGRGRIRVRDNGRGIPPETVTSILDFTTRTSSREAYVAPDRGAQGNALKTVLAMPFALSGEEGRVEIVACGVRHTILFRVDQIRQAPVIDHQTEPAPVRSGTSVTVHWPATSRSELADAKEQFLQIAEAYSLLNPHLALTVVWRDPADAEEPEHVRRVWAATRSDWRKWTPAAPTPPDWYGRDDLERLIGAYISYDSENGLARTVNEFVGIFAGLTATAKRKSVTDAAGLSRAPLTAVLNGTEFDHDAVDRLLEAMCQEARPIKPERLGIIGREHVASRLEAMAADPSSFQYRLVKGVTSGGRPWLLEVAFAHRPGGRRRIITGVNWSPGIREPFRTLGYLLGERYCGSSSDPVLIFVHLAMPRPRYTDRGKSAIALPEELREALANAVEAVTKPWCKQRVAEIRDHKRLVSRRERLSRSARRTSIKDAVWQVLPGAYNKASSGGAYPALARQIYYAARPPILELTGKDTLDANYFSYSLLPLFMRERPNLTKGWRVHFKPRGNLTEPHTDRKIPLGTAEVDQYRRGWTNGVFSGPSSFMGPWSPETCGPHNRFGGVLVIEKEGFADLLIEIGLGRKYDLAIIGNEGQSVEAELALVDALGLPLFVLHDFDRTGLTITENLRSGTWRHRYENSFPVVDVGLRLHQVDGLEDEPISPDNLKSVSDYRLQECGATEAEIDFLRRRRVELNALTTEALVTLVEDALREHNVAKVIPNAKDLANAWRSAKAHSDLVKAVEEACTKADQWQQAAAPADLSAEVELILREDPTMPWHDAIWRIARRLP
jgi:DNA topoisomerase VI subunit B